MSYTIPVTCDLDCGGGCAMLAHVENGRVTKITQNPLRGPYMNACAKGLQAARTLYAPDRLTKPLLRTGPRNSGQFKEIPWPDALDIVAERLSDIKTRYGNESILLLGGSGACRGALHNTFTLPPRFLRLFGGHVTTTGGYSAAATSFAQPFVLGSSPSGIDPGTLQFSNLIILWGANFADARSSCEAEARIKEARSRGVEVIVIDPRRTSTVTSLGTQWIPIRPATDTAMMMAVLYVLHQENLVDHDFLEKHSVGFDQLGDHILGLDNTAAKTPQWAEKVCGTPSDTIVQLALQYGRTRPTALIPGLSIQRTLGGEEAVRMAIALQLATGNLGVLGGSSGSAAWSRLPRPRAGEIGVPANPVQATVPVYRWPDAVLEGKKGGYPSDIKAIYNVGGNYVVQGSDIRKNIRAMAEVDFAVCHDIFLTPTAQQCDVVLPTTTFLERDDIVFASGGNNYLLFSSQAVPPAPETKNDYDIFCGLAERLGFLAEFSENRSAEEWLTHFMEESEVPNYETFRQSGIHLGADQLRVGLSDFAADPKLNPLDTPSGLVEISSEAYAETGFSSIPKCRILPTSDDYPLHLITPHPKYRVHSQGNTIPWFMEREEHKLWIHPNDATERGIENDQQVLVSSPQGKVRLPARVTENIMLGVVSINQGVWPSFDSDGTDTAGAANVLTSTEPTMPSRGTRTHFTLVQVSLTPVLADCAASPPSTGQC